MEIELYEPYHIGIKFFDFVNLNTLKIQLMEELKEKKYEIIEDKIPLPLEKIKEIIAIKKKTKIEILYKVIAVNIRKDLTKSQDDIIEIFNEIITILKKTGYNLEKTIPFFELVSNLTIKTEKKPIEVFNKSLKVDLGTFEDLGKINLNGFKFRSEKSESEFLELVFEPRLISPEDKYFMRVVYRTKEINNIIKLHKNFNDNVLKFLNLIEGD